MNAREIAARVLLRVLREDAFAAAVLDAELARAAQLEANDRGLATELVYGTLRFWGWLDDRVARRATRRGRAIDPRVRVQLVLAAYQLFFLRGVPAFAAVNEAVGAVRAAQGARVAAFANAVLRKLADEAQNERVDPSAAIVRATPKWLLRELAGALGGEETARAYVRASLEPPPIGIRVRDASEREVWMAKLRAAAPEGASIEPGQASPLAILVRGAGRPQALPGWSEGEWTIQEEGSQVVALALGARPGDEVLDACAGRGNKTGLLARAVAPGGAVDAADLHASKLARLEEELSRGGVHPRATYAVDWSVGSGGVEGRLYDRVLVDAPCTGTGTLRRRPELALRRERDDVRALADLQLAIVTRAAGHLKPGGTLVYAVCSVLREEGEGVVGRLGAAAGLEKVTERRLLPMVEGTDGYYVATLRKRSQEG